MGDINLGQFLRNAFDYSIGKQPAQQPTKASNENFQQLQQQSVRMVNETMQNLQRNFFQQIDILNTQMQLKQLSDMDKSFLLKDLFNFPKEMKELLETLVKPMNPQGAAVQMSRELLMLQTLDMARLMQMLQTNGKQANEKLAKLIATLNQSGVFNTQQLKEMAVLINACIPAMDASPQNLLKSLLLMYLPWLPLSDGSKLNVEYEEDENKKSSDSENVVTILITTKNFGLTRVVLYKEDNDLTIEVNCSEKFPKKEFHESLKAESTGFNLESSVEFTTRKPSPDEEENPETSIKFNRSAKISPHLLLIVHSIINIVMELEDKAQLVSDRSKKIN